MLRSINNILTIRNWNESRRLKISIGMKVFYLHFMTTELLLKLIIFLRKLMFIPLLLTHCKGNLIFTIYHVPWLLWHLLIFQFSLRLSNYLCSQGGRTKLYWIAKIGKLHALICIAIEENIFNKLSRSLFQKGRRSEKAIVIIFFTPAQQRRNFHNLLFHCSHNRCHRRIL